MRLDPGGETLWLLAPAERKLIRVRLDTLDPDAIIALPEGCRDIDIAPDGGLPYAAVNLGDTGRVSMMNLTTRKVQYELKVGSQTGPLQFLKNGKVLLAGSPAEQLLVVFDVATGQRIVELPLSLKPERFCFKQDGGQLFITGAGQDAVAVVYPFQTQVAGTILAGHEPGAMATSVNPDFLFVANRSSGEVTVLDIQTQKVRAVVPVGQDPDYICITPDNNFALVLNRRSGDMAVIRVDAMAGRRTKAGPLFTMIPVGSMPVAAVVVEV
ncbi:MAG: beta-propeller fold lactonase family protein, partial [Acidobacteria bacterium]|nr:beta-propeller fold lactonase family protein [Acidobacteriota bacterium]